MITTNLSISRSHFRRGGTFFTMLLFIMMLVSCALMYYYFQRSRYLEREVIALKSGQPSENDSGWLGWMNSGRATPETAQPTPAASADTNATGPASQPAVAAVATPLPAATPAAAIPATTMTMELPAYTPPATTVLQPAEGTTAEAPRESDTVPDSESNGAQATPTPPAKLDSLYDAQTPAVRVRAPRRN